MTNQFQVLFRRQYDRISDIEIAHLFGVDVHIEFGVVDVFGNDALGIVHLETSQGKTGLNGVDLLLKGIDGLFFRGLAFRLLGRGNSGHENQEKS